MDFHELSEIFPDMAKDEMDSLRRDIRENGLQCPIELFDGKILDGRHRYRACVLEGVEPEFCDVSPDDPFRYVVSLNMARRHLSVSQRAMIAAKFATLRNGSNQHKNTTKQGISGVGLSRDKPSFEDVPGKSTKDLAEAARVSKSSIDRARSVLEKSPELAEKVAKGEVKVKAAAQQVAKSKKKQLSPAAIRKGLNRPYGELVRGMDKLLASRGHERGSAMWKKASQAFNVIGDMMDELSGGVR